MQGSRVKNSTLHYSEVVPEGLWKAEDILVQVLLNVEVGVPHTTGRNERGSRQSPSTTLPRDLDQPNAQK